MHVVADTAAVAVLVRAAIVPSVLRRRSLGEPSAAFVTVQLPGRARVDMEFEFEFRAEGPLAVPAGVGHIRVFIFRPYSYTGTFTVRPRTDGNACFEWFSRDSEEFSALGRHRISRFGDPTDSCTLRKHRDTATAVYRTRTSNLAPPASLSPASTSHPWAVATLSTTNRPYPSPSRAVPYPCSKTRSRSAAGTPGPSSAT